MITIKNFGNSYCTNCVINGSLGNAIVEFTNLNNGSYVLYPQFTEDGIFLLNLIIYHPDFPSPPFQNGIFQTWIIVTKKIALNLQIVGGLIFKPDTDLEIVAQVKDEYGYPVSGAQINLTIYYPNNTIWLKDVQMSELENGVYQFKGSLPSIEGTYVVTGKVVFGTLTGYDSKTFHVISIVNATASVEYGTVAQYVWSYSYRNLTYYNQSVSETIKEIVEKIWNVVRPTNQSVIIGEALISNTLSSTQSIVYQVNISVPEKEGYNIGDWVPIKINFWFVNNSECVSQSTSNIITPYCEPLTAIFLGKVGSNVTQTITMRPINLEPGKVYKVIREVSIDPNERWIVYGRGEIGSIYVLERNQEKKVITNATYSFGGVSSQYQIYNQENSVKNEQNMLKLIVAGIIIIVIVFLAYKTKKEGLLALIFLTFLFASVIGAQEVGTVNYIDDIPPNITVISPEPKTYDRAFIDLIYVVSDNVAVDKCWYELNGNISDLPWCNNKTLNLPSGHYDLKVYVNDTSGNTVNYRVVFDVSIGGTPYYGVGLMNFYISLNITPSTQYLEIYKYGKLVFNRTITKGEIISLVPGTYTFVFSAEGYKTKKVDLNVTRSFILTFSLEKEEVNASQSQISSVIEKVKGNLTPNKLADVAIVVLVIMFLYLIIGEKFKKRL
jgi:hypothetical protein